MVDRKHNPRLHLLKMRAGIALVDSVGEAKD